jgi:predicted amidohydrolase
MNGMRKILPDRPIEDLPAKDIIFHILYDLDEKPQVPGYQYIYSGRTYENDGIYPQWKAIRDENGRIMVAICFNMHIGDAWEHADDPRYPERFSSFAYRMGINYIIYPMTH